MRLSIDGGPIRLPNMGRKRFVVTPRQRLRLARRLRTEVKRRGLHEVKPTDISADDRVMYVGNVAIVARFRIVHADFIWRAMVDAI